MRALETASLGAVGLFVARSLYIATHSNYRLETSALRDRLPFLSIVVPARNEERQIECCVRSLLAQQYPAGFEVIVVDDESTDSTLEILTSLAGEDPRLRVMRGEPLPEGWVGKPWACMQGARAAKGELLLFTDADTVHEPLAAAAAGSYLEAFSLHAVSVLGDQELVTLPERAILPSIFWTIAFGVGSLDAVNDPERPNALFNGQYVMIPATVYREFGGHDAVRGEIAEDYELAHLMKQRGYRTHLVGASGLLRTRMYRSFAEIWHGFGKNLALGARDNSAALLAGAGYFALVAPIPAVLFVRALLQRRYGAAAQQLAAIVATIAAAEDGMRQSRLPKGSGLWLPVGLTVMLGILAKSAIAHGRGSVQWRGRRYG